MNEYRLILPGGDRAMNNKCRFSIHSWYYMYDDDDDDDSEEVLNDIAQIWGKLEKKGWALNNPKWEEKLYRISYNFSSLSFVALKWKGKLKKNFFMKLALLALCAMLFMMTTAQWCYETSLEWVFFSTIYLPRWISLESCYVTFNSQREIYDNFHVFLLCEKFSWKIPQIRVITK